MQFLRNLFVLIALISIMASCTYSINMIHTQGTASDVVDENQTPTADISAPISGLPQ